MEKILKDMKTSYYQYNINLVEYNKPRPVELVACLMDVPNTRALVFKVLENGKCIHYEKIIVPKSIVKYARLLDNYDVLVSENKPYKKHKMDFMGAMDIINYYIKNIEILSKLEKWGKKYDNNKCTKRIRFWGY